MRFGIWGLWRLDGQAAPVVGHVVPLRGLLQSWTVNARFQQNIAVSQDQLFIWPVSGFNVVAELRRCKRCHSRKWIYIKSRGSSRQEAANEDQCRRGWWRSIQSTGGNSKLLGFSYASSVVHRLPLVFLGYTGIQRASLWRRNLQKHRFVWHCFPVCCAPTLKCIKAVPLLFLTHSPRWEGPWLR